MYHHFRNLKPDASKDERDWAVSPVEFEKQLAHLAEKGYHTIDFAQLGAYFKKREPLPPRPAIISIDDGYHSVFEVAAPLLKKYGLIANVFALPGNAIYPAYLNWEQIIQLKQEGHHFGSHTLKPSESTQAEPGGDQEATSPVPSPLLEDKLGQPVVALLLSTGQL